MHVVFTSTRSIKNATRHVRAHLNKQTLITVVKYLLFARARVRLQIRKRSSVFGSCKHSVLRNGSVNKSYVEYVQL